METTGSDRAEPGERFLLPALSALLLFSAAMSLFWRIAHDAPLLLYSGRAIGSFGLVPYRDLFDQNPPFALLANVLAERFVGISDLRFRLVDLALLAGIGAVTAAALRPLGRRIALVAAILFPLAALGLGENQAFQRDGIAVLPLSLALLPALRGAPLPVPLRGFLIGLAVGGAALVKPQAVIVLPALLLPIALAATTPRERIRSALLALSGAIPGLLLLPALTLLVLRKLGGDTAFLEIVRFYWPRYAELDGEARRLVGAAAWPLRIRNGISGATRIAPLLATAVAGYFVARRSSEERHRRAAISFALLLGLLLLHVFIAGKFWRYHFLPATFAAALLSGFLALHSGGRRGLRLLALLAVAVVVARPPDLRYWSFAELPPLKDGRVDFIASYLRANLRPGDTVQPLDSAGGAVHAMLLADAPPATRFVADFHFYHHCSLPYSRALRRELIASLESRPPRFVVHVGHRLPEGDDFRPSGPDCGAPFPELADFLARTYHEVASRPDVHILERTTDAAPR